ncbi:MAG TPA: endonuclease domain-containing protein [Thermoanaerobaculia bacterium]
MSEIRDKMAGMREQAREMRKNPTPAEEVLWERLRDRKLHGLKFRRQCPIGPFIADFCCQDRRVIVELDGEIHETAQGVARDQGRDAYLRGLNYVVLRFPNQQVLEDPDSVVDEISTSIWKTPLPWSRIKS